MKATSPEMMRRSRGMRFGGETLNMIPAEAKLRPLRDQIVLEPEDVVYSRYLIVDHKTKPLKGKVLAIGPGHYPKRYDHAEKHKRTKTWESKVFRPTEVKVGDRVELGGAEIEGYAFEGFFWGDRYCIWCTERDVAGILERPDHSDSLDQGTTP